MLNNRSGMNSEEILTFLNNQTPLPSIYLVFNYVENILAAYREEYAKLRPNFITISYAAASLLKNAKICLNDDMVNLIIHSEDIKSFSQFNRGSILSLFKVSKHISVYNRNNDSKEPGVISFYNNHAKESMILLTSFFINKLQPKDQPPPIKKQKLNAPGVISHKTPKLK